MPNYPGEILLSSEPSSQDRVIPLIPVSKSGVQAALKDQAKVAQTWARAQEFSARAGSFCCLPDDQGNLASVLVGTGDESDPLDPFAAGDLANRLPPGLYGFDENIASPGLAALGWLLAAYQFDRYVEKPARQCRLVCPPGTDRSLVLNIAQSVWLTRDLVNTPAEDMGPSELEAVSASLAEEFGAGFESISGDRLAADFPLIHTVGRAGDDVPRLLKMHWGDQSHPKVTLVGKGVCFDTGGLDLKPSSAMLLMKKDMGGAANVLGLARMIMAAGLRVRLCVLIPAVENAVAGNAFRPGDVFKSRKGLTVEIGNTDAEGRLVLADALALADEEEPDLLIDMATLTGAARVALGPDLPPFYTGDDALAAQLTKAAEEEKDPLWRMPLWPAYRQMLASPIADINNAGKGGFAGSITAALFLKEFVDRTKTYVHFDVFAWTPAARPAHPIGGEAQGIRALFKIIADRYNAELPD